MSRTDIRFVHISCPTREEALAIGRALIDERLAASVNIRPHETIYRWDGRITEGVEHGVIAKTTAAAVPPLCKRVRALHSYVLPPIAALPVADGLDAYLDWIAAETAG